MVKLTRNQALNQFAHFIIVGTINTAFNYAIFSLSYFLLKLDYLLAGAIGVAFASVTGFLMNRAWTFSSKIPFLQGSIKYFSIQLFCLLVHSLIQWIATGYFQIPPTISQLMGIAVTMFINFSLSKHFVFKEMKEYASSTPTF